MLGVHAKIKKRLEGCPIPRNCGIFITNPNEETKVFNIVRSLVGEDGLLVSNDTWRREHGRIPGLWFSHAIFDDVTFQKKHDYLRKPNIIVARFSSTIQENSEIYRPVSFISSQSSYHELFGAFYRFLERKPLKNTWEL